MNKLEVPIVLALQERLRPWDEEMQFVTDVSNPNNLFLFVCPIVFWVQLRRRGNLGGLGALIVTNFADYFNAVLKFPLAGDRPYWVDSRVRQFKDTCESGYGMPSGHAMVSSTIMFYLIFSYGGAHRRLLTGLGAVVAMVVALSRVHTGSHFPSQVALGNIVGISLAVIASYKHQVQQAASKGSRSLAIQLLGAGALFYIAALLELVSLEAFGVDPLASVALARRGCVSLEAVHRTTSPMKGIARNAGIYVGVGIGVGIRGWQTTGTSAASTALSHHSVLQSMEILAGVGLLHAVDRLFTDGTQLFAVEYEISLNFFRFSMLFALVAWLTPACRMSELVVGNHWCLSKVQKFC